MHFGRPSLTVLTATFGLFVLSALGIGLDAASALQPVPSGRLSGTITDSRTGAPIAGVRVAVGSPALPEPRQTTTDRDGRYDVASLPPGAYTVSVRAETYVGSGFAFRRLHGTQGSITVAAQQHRDQVDIRLIKEASVSGRILQVDGTPAVGAAVNLLRPHSSEGQRLLASLGTALTDSDGRFRVAGLAPGDYYVSAFEPDPTVTTGIRSAHSPTYYPGSADAAGARRIRVATATDIVGIDFVIQRVPWTRILGLAKRADDATLRFAAIILQPNDKEGITDIVLDLTPGATLTGRVRFESHGASGPDVTTLRLYAPLVDGTKFGGEPKSRMSINGRFELVGVDAGSRLIRAMQVPAPWSLERVTQGGQDITYTPVAIKQGEKLEDVELTFTDSAPTIRGVVRNASGRAIVDGLVVAFPVDRTLWRAASRHIGSARTDWLGHYTIGPLPPGDYLMVSVTEYDEADLFERETLDQLSRLATRVMLSLGQRRLLDLIDVPF
jgi:5-hydroxyisourate hydrolase-like protein (transthyretin family)